MDGSRSMEDLSEREECALARLIHVSPAPPVVISNDNSQGSSEFEILGVDDIVEENDAGKKPKKLTFGNVTAYDDLVDIELRQVAGDTHTPVAASNQEDNVDASNQEDNVDELAPEIRDLHTITNPVITVAPDVSTAPVEESNISNQKISRQVLQDVLDTRPTLQLGRSMSMRFRLPSAFSRRSGSAHSSLPMRGHSAVSSRSDEDVLRSRTLPSSSHTSTSIITLEDIEDVAIGGGLGSDEDDEESNRKDPPPLYRQSTRRLKERMVLHREQTLARSSVVRESPWQNFKHVKWPKVKSQWKIIRSWELWKGHMKKIEGHFGTAIVSYFIFLRFLFLLNLLIFSLWFGFVVIPGIIYEISESPANTASLATCVYPTSDFPSFLCPADTPATALAQTSVTGESLFYQLESANVYTCTAPSTASTFNVQNCGFTAMDFNNTISYSVAFVEGGTALTVSPEQPTSSDCTFTNSSSSIADIIELRHCTVDIAPRLLWYNYIIDFFLGQGIYNDTILFYGRYGNTTVVGGKYSLPMAYLLTTFVIYGISVVLLVVTLGNAYNESYTQFSNKRKITFSNKVFTAWDFNITDSDTAKLKKVHIRTNLEEELADFDKRSIKRTWKDIVKVVIIRFFTNLFTFIVLVGASTAIYYSAQYGLSNEGSTFTGLVLPVVITTLNFILPLLFSFLARFERFKTQSGEIKMTLVRTIIVRMSSLIVLMISLFVLVSCTQSVTTDTTTSTCTFSAQELTSVVSSNTTTSCPTCWETYIGTEFYTLGITNFVVSASGTIAAETGRNILSRIKFMRIGEKIGKGNFNIPKSILDLIYTQALLWMAFFFSPFQPVVILMTTVLLFYVKRYSLTINLVPDKRGSFRAARTNFLFVLLMLVTLFIILIPAGFIIGSFNPSATCGPFRGKQFIFSIITEGIASLTCTVQQFFDFVASVGFVLPFIIFLLLVIYAMYVSLKARQERFKLVKKQLVLEGANVTHIVNKLDAVLGSLDQSEETDGEQPKVIKQHIIDIRNNLSEQGATKDFI